MPRRKPKDLPDPIPESIPDHPVPPRGHVRHGKHYHNTLSRPFRSPFTAPPHQWPTNAKSWGLYEAYPSKEWPMPPMFETRPSRIFEGGEMRESRDRAYPAFMYKLESDLLCGRHPTLITEWEIDDDLLATLGPCWRCRRKGVAQMRECAMRGVKIPWTAPGRIPARALIRIMRPFSGGWDETDDFINDDSEEESEAESDAGRPDDADDDEEGADDHADFVPDSHGDSEDEDVDDDEEVNRGQKFSSSRTRLRPRLESDDEDEDGDELPKSRDSRSSSSKRRRIIDPEDDE